MPLHFPGWMRAHRSLLSAIALLVSIAFNPQQAMADEVDFERDVAPILIQNCLECHSALDPSGGLNLTQLDSFRKGGDSGSVLADRAESSLLYRRIADGEMPPEKNGKQHSLASDDVAKIREWIDKGAAWPEGRVLDLFERTNAKRAGRDWWAWQPLRIADEHMPPQAEAIDYFIEKKLVEHQLTPAPASRRRELIRRVYFDLIGLPPSSDEVHAFEASESPDAYEQIVDRL